MELEAKIYVAGHRGLVGSAICRRLDTLGFRNIVTRTSVELDLREQARVRDFFAKEAPDYVFFAAAKVGGIHANDSYPAEFIYDNLMIESNIIDAAYRNSCRKLLFLGSSCIYPKLCPQPIKEEYLLTGKLEPTNDAYALAKISGIKMCQAYRKQYGFNAISAMPTNLYGPGDNFHPENSHVMPALIRRFHEAREADVPEVVIWGTGMPRREFLHVDDLAEALVFLMQNYSDYEHVNTDELLDMLLALYDSKMMAQKNGIFYSNPLLVPDEKGETTAQDWARGFLDCLAWDGCLDDLDKLIEQEDEDEESPLTMAFVVLMALASGGKPADTYEDDAEDSAAGAGSSDSKAASGSADSSTAPDVKAAKVADDSQDDEDDEEDLEFVPLEPEELQNMLNALPECVNLIYQTLRGVKPAPQQATSQKIPRNSPCPCGSGKKYKQCCLLKDE